MREVPAKPQVLFLTKAQEGRVTRQVCAVVSPSPPPTPQMDPPSSPPETSLGLGTHLPVPQDWSRHMDSGCLEEARAVQGTAVCTALHTPRHPAPVLVPRASRSAWGPRTPEFVISEPKGRSVTASVPAFVGVPSCPDTSRAGLSVIR